jgi:hypothetical protein
MNAQRRGVVASSCPVNQTGGVARLLSSLLLLLLHLEVHGRSGRNMKLWELGEFNLIESEKSPDCFEVLLVSVNWTG